MMGMAEIRSLQIIMIPLLPRDDCSRASLLEDADDTIILSDLGLTAGCSIRRGC